MVMFVLTRRGFSEMRGRIQTNRDAVWVGDGVLSVAEVDELRRSGMNLTVFEHVVARATLERDVATLAEHHPGEPLWVEFPRP